MTKLDGGSLGPISSVENLIAATDGVVGHSRNFGTN